MKENFMVCNCKQVSYADIAHVLETSNNFNDAIDAFDDVQKATNCSTGCGGCYQKVLDVVSEILSGAVV